MPRIKGYLGNIPRFYRFQTFDCVLFGYITAHKKSLPSVSVHKAIIDSLFDFDLCEDDYCFDNAKQTHYRVVKAFAEMEMGFDRIDGAGNIMKFYIQQTYDHVCYGYVRACDRCFPGIDTEGAINDFLRDFNLSDDIYSYQNAHDAYYRIGNSFADMGLMV